MSYVGTVTNGVVILPADVHLTNGIKVRIEPIEEKNPAPTLAESLRDFIGVIDGPEDLAENHDYYIHGARKK
ncbi:MAG: hypothetical protein M3Y82_09445 [Verrucomicrobiota bacterium]|nr:hypothetical protein [Verrucomicrobiota bacterium]